MKNERGSTIVAVLLILTLLTIIGIAAINSSTTERATSTNYLLYERVFFSAEAGLEHAKAALQNQILARTAPGSEPKFTFLWVPGDPAITPFPANPDWAQLAKFPPGIPGYKIYLDIDNSPLDAYEYKIYVWDNRDEPAGPAGQNGKVDLDGTIFMLAQAVGPRNSRSCIFTTLDAGLDSNPLSGYNAQEGAGPGKGYSSLDKGGVGDFTIQVGRLGGLELH